MTDCLVVGGGFLGGHVAIQLAAAGHRVRVYSRSFNEWLTANPLRGGAIELIDGEVPPGPGLLELIDEAEVVFYLAGSSTPTMAHTDPGGTIKSYVVPAAALIDLVRSSSTRRVVLASSGGTVYGLADMLPTPENHPTRPISVHGINALAVERYAMFFAEHHGLDTVVLRYSNPYGPGQPARYGQGVIAHWCQALSRCEDLVVYGDPATRRDLLYVEDAAAATIAAAFDGHAAGIYNVAAGRSWTLAELLEAVQRVAGKSAVIRYMPGRSVDVPVTELDCARLRAQTGWTPRTCLEEGIAMTWAWTLRPRQAAAHEATAIAPDIR